MVISHVNVFCPQLIFCHPPSWATRPDGFLTTLPSPAHSTLSAVPQPGVFDIEIILQLWSTGKAVYSQPFFLVNDRKLFPVPHLSLSLSASLSLSVPLCLSLSLSVCLSISRSLARVCRDFCRVPTFQSFDGGCFCICSLIFTDLFNTV